MEDAGLILYYLVTSAAVATGILLANEIMIYM